MELSFGRRYIGEKAVTTVRVKSDHAQNLKDHVRVETARGNLIVTDSFDVIERLWQKEDAESVYGLYVIENHVQQEERFTPEREEKVDEDIATTAQAVTDLEIEQMETAQTIMEHEIAIMELQEQIGG